MANNNNTTEIFKTIPGFSNYSVSNSGNVRNNKTLHNFSLTTKQKYNRINLVNDNGEIKSKAIHVLVAEAFIPNDDPVNKKTVNHKDRNTNNNIVSNLEWMTGTENVNHAVKTGRKVGDNRKRCEITSSNGIKKVFDSVRLAANEYGLRPENLAYYIRKYGKFYSNKYNEWFNAKYNDRKFKKMKGGDWKPIPVDGFRYLDASKSGKIRNRRTGRIINGSSDGNYLRIKSDKAHNYVSYSIHRLVALTFIPNPDNKPNVNHRDGNKLNNTADNLEWATQSENMQHAVATGLVDLSKRAKIIRKIYQLELDGNIIKLFDSIDDAEKEIGKDSGLFDIAGACKGYRKSKGLECAYGYGWCYVEDYKKDLKPNGELFKTFPELIGKSVDKLPFDRIRKIVQDKYKPIWQIDLDGTRLNWFNSIYEIEEKLKIPTNRIRPSLNDEYRLGSGYRFEYMTFEELMNPDKDYVRKIPKSVKEVLKIDDDTAKLRKNVIDILHKSLDDDCKFFLKSRPIVQESLDGQILDYFPNVTLAYKKLGMGRGCIEEVLNGNSKTSGGFKFRYMTLTEMVE